MRSFIGVCLAAACAVAVQSAPSAAGEAETAAWSAIQKVNEMAEEARARCAANGMAPCDEATSLSSASFSLIRDARNCDTGRYPMTCGRLRASLGEIDALYAGYRERIGPERAAANRDRLRPCRILPLTGSCAPAPVPATASVRTQVTTQ